MKKIMAGISLLLMAFCGLAFFGSYYWVNNSGRILEAVNPRQTVVGVIFEGDRKDGGWNEVLLESFRQLDNEGCRFVYVDFAHTGDGSFRTAVQRLVDREKAEIIFHMGVSQPADMATVSREYPQVKFFSGCGQQSLPNVCSLVLRLYQAQYEAGMLAAAASQTGELAIVASRPQPLLNAELNAFAAGARRMRPTARVHVIWGDPPDDHMKVVAACEKMLAAYPIDVVGQANQYREVLDICRRRGLKAIGVYTDLRAEYGDVLLGTVFWNSGDLIRDLVKDVTQGRFTPESRYVSIDENLGLIVYGPLDEDSRARIQDADRQLRYTNCDVFYGPVRDNKGRLRVPAGQNLSDEAMTARLDWFVEGILEDPPETGGKNISGGQNDKIAGRRNRDVSGGRQVNTAEQKK